MEINRTWEMPNSITFSIQNIKNLILKYANEGMVVIDPFANGGNIRYSLLKSTYISNDLNEKYNTDYHMEALDFLKMQPSDFADLILYDPPYSPRQVKEVYEGVGIELFAENTQMSYWSKQKDEIARILKIGGICISFGWNSNGIGKGRGFEIQEILLVAHGGSKNDTICVVDKKIAEQQKLF